MVKARFSLLLVSLLLSLLSSANAQQEATQRSLGGAGADKSYVERLLSGVTEGVHYASKALGVGQHQQQENNKRTPKKVRLALVGFGRTGTTSIVSALQQSLGYNFVHDDTLTEVADLHAKLAAKDITMDEFVEECGQRGFDAIFFFSDEFLQWAANAKDVKVLLSTRDSARKWAESWVKIAPMVTYGESRPFIWSQTVRDLLPGYFQRIYYHISTQGQPEKFMDIPTLEKAYEAHLVKVRKMIPKDRLLEFNVKQGWGPLCEFLNVPVPETKFPHVNDRVVVLTLVGTFWLITWIWPLAPLVAICLIWKLIKLALGSKSGKTTATKRGKKKN